MNFLHLTWLWLKDNSDRRYWIAYKRCLLGFLMALLLFWFLNWLAYGVTNLVGYMHVSDMLYLGAWWLVLMTFVMSLTKLDEDVEKNNGGDDGSA